MTSDAFERQVHRIHELLERSHEDVKWNERIPDPDNPKQLRQIDITIRSGGSLTIVECRLSNKPQNVKWVEELIGRRVSLGADAIIGVASAGFTSGAMRKASRYGVVLRDFRELTDAEIAGWPGRVTLMLYYYQYSDIVLAVGFAPDSIGKIDHERLKPELRAHPVLISVFNAAERELEPLKLLARDDKRPVKFRIVISPDSLQLCGEEVLEIVFQGTARLISQQISCARVTSYGDPSDGATQRSAIVQRFELGDTNIVHDADRLAIEIDLSELTLPPLSRVRFFRTVTTTEKEYASFAIVHPEMLGVVRGKLAVELYVPEP